MNAYRKIKIFKFSDYENYEACQDKANDYFGELSKKDIDCEVVLTVDYIAVLLPKGTFVKKDNETVKISVGELAKIFERNVNSDS